MRVPLPRFGSTGWCLDVYDDGDGDDDDDDDDDDDGDDDGDDDDDPDQRSYVNPVFLGGWCPIMPPVP